MADKPPLKILLLGGSGQVGTQWRHLLDREASSTLEWLAPSRQALDLSYPEAVRACVLREAPDLIVNAAAHTDVDRAESEPEQAYALNATLPTVLAQTAHELGASLLHYSTDYVFAGTGQQAHREDAPVEPHSVYGSTKALGEAGIQEHLARHLILRTSWVMGAYGSNFLKTVLQLAVEREALHIVADQVGAPTPARLLASMGWLAWQSCARLESVNHTRAPWGLYHVASRGTTTWFEYARFVVSEALTRGWNLKTGPVDIHPISSADYPTPARRPANSQLDVSRFEQTFGATLPPWQEGVRAILDELRSPLG